MVLGINEPEEILSPPVRYYPWDGNNGDSSTAPDAAADASVDTSGGDTSIDRSPTPPDSAGIADASVDARREASIDSPPDGPRCFLQLPDGGGVCGLGCSKPCPLDSACLRDGDCASGRCYAARCTLPTCLNKVRDGDETDLDCGGSCASCGPGQKCRVSGDCASEVCTGGLCQARPLDASSDAPRFGDSGTDGASTFDAADSGPVLDATSEPDAATATDASTDAADEWVTIDTADVASEAE
jgi:hypothetical protein